MFFLTFNDKEYTENKYFLFNYFRLRHVPCKRGAAG